MAAGLVGDRDASVNAIVTAASGRAYGKPDAFGDTINVRNSS